MDLRVLFMQRTERYEGQHAPEAVLCWDEYSIDENPEGFNEALEKAKKPFSKDEVAGFALVRISIDGDKVRAMCLEQIHKLEGEVSRDDA